MCMNEHRVNQNSDVFSGAFALMIGTNDDSQHGVIYSNQCLNTAQTNVLAVSYLIMFICPSICGRRTPNTQSLLVK